MAKGSYLDRKLKGVQICVGMHHLVVIFVANLKIALPVLVRHGNSRHQLFCSCHAAPLMLCVVMSAAFALVIMIVAD